MRSLGQPSTQTSTHREQGQTFCRGGQVQQNVGMEPAAESTLVLVSTQTGPDHTDFWAHFKAQCCRHGSLSPFFGNHLHKFSIWLQTCSGICFVPVRGLELHLVCEFIHTAVVMHYELWEWSCPRVRFTDLCRTFNGQDYSFVWDWLPTQQSPRVSSSPQCLLALRAAASWYMLLLCAVCLPAAHHELWLLNHSLKAARARSEGLWLKFKRFGVGERQWDNGLCTQFAKASNCKLKKV